MKKTATVFEKVKESLLNGYYGESGDRFLTVRELAEEYSISYVTSQRVIKKLREEGHILLKGKKCYITSGTMKEKAPLSKVLQKINTKNKYIGLHVNKVNNIFFASVTEKIQRFLKEKGFKLIIMSSDGRYEEEKNIITSFIEEIGVRGIISFPGHDKRVMKLYNSCIIPVLLVGTEDIKQSISSVSVNNDKGARMAAKHLLECGYYEFCYVGTSKLTTEKDKRYNGFVNEIEKAGKNIESFRIDCDYPKENRGELKNYIIKAKTPLGIFCYHDEIAAEVYRICRQYKKQIPDEVGVVGFDDLPIANMVSPKLTTISYRYDIMAETAVKLLLEMIEGTYSGAKVSRIQPALIIRESTKIQK